jgi:hypothetical protein
LTQFDPILNPWMPKAQALFVGLDDVPQDVQTRIVLARVASVVESSTGSPEVGWPRPYVKAPKGSTVEKFPVAWLSDGPAKSGYWAEFDDQAIVDVHVHAFSKCQMCGNTLDSTRVYGASDGEPNKVIASAMHIRCALLAAHNCPFYNPSIMTSTDYSEGNLFYVVNSEDIPALDFDYSQMRNWGSWEPGKVPFIPFDPIEFFLRTDIDVTGYTAKQLKAQAKQLPKT